MLSRLLLAFRLFWTLLQKHKDPRVQILLDLLGGMGLYGAMARQSMIIEKQFLGLGVTHIAPGDTAVLTQTLNRTSWFRDLVLASSTPETVLVRVIHFAGVPVTRNTEGTPLTAFTWAAVEDRASGPQRLIFPGQTILVSITNEGADTVVVSGGCILDEVAWDRELHGGLPRFALVDQILYVAPLVSPAGV